MATANKASAFLGRPFSWHGPQVAVQVLFSFFICIYLFVSVCVCVCLCIDILYIGIIIYLKVPSLMHPLVHSPTSCFLPFLSLCETDRVCPREV